MDGVERLMVFLILGIQESQLKFMDLNGFGEGGSEMRGERFFVLLVLEEKVVYFSYLKLLVVLIKL